MSSKREGMTLIEVLIALAVLAVVLSLAYGAITSSLQVQSAQEAAATTQGKLRRVIEVISQDLRSAVFGSITDNPYVSDNRQVSFMMLTGGAGYPVAKTTNFSNSNYFEALTASSAGFAGSQVVLVNSNGTGVVVPVTSVSNGSSSAYKRFNISCRNTIDYGDSVLMFQIETSGIRYDANAQNMYLRTAGGTEQPFAFDISDLRFDYVYTFTMNVAGTTTKPTETVIVMSQPKRGGHGLPVRSFIQGDFEYTLTRLQVVVESQAESGQKVVDHAYSGQVDLSRAAHFKVEEIVPCS